MYNIIKERFVIGEDITLEELESFAKLDRSTKPSDLTRDERLFIKYCYAIQNTTYYIHTKDGRELATMPNDEAKKMMVDTLMFTLNSQATSHISLKEGLTMSYNSLMPALLGLYDQDVIEFALLQQGIRIKCNSDDFKIVATGRLEYEHTYALEKDTPVSIRELADSVQAKVEALNEIEAE